MIDPSVNPSFRLFLIVAGLLWRLNQSLAVDPPPPYILEAPPETQRHYIEQRSEESERLRGKVAKRRFQERNQRREAVAAGLERELAFQRELMLSQSGARAGVSDPRLIAPGADRIPERLAFRLKTFGGFGFFLLLLYLFRDKVFSLSQASEDRVP
ncbi:MAG TPA: hypothetical protein VGR78_02610 [Verrucomicrobiae bacterium]|jgi:hypothetical protein|nr:hypothetical protein [Verrucomicrobiae bacterium]